MHTIFNILYFACMPACLLDVFVGLVLFLFAQKICFQTEYFALLLLGFIFFSNLSDLSGAIFAINYCIFNKLHEFSTFREIIVV